MRIPSASINLPTFDFGQGGDIYFEFKTTIESGVILYSKGPEDYIKVDLRGNKYVPYLNILLLHTTDYTLLFYLSFKFTFLKLCFKKFVLSKFVFFLT